METGIWMIMRSSMMRFCSFFVVLLLWGCTEVDDRLGQSLLPDNQQMNIEVFTVGDGVETFLYRQDSVPSSRMGSAYLGRMVDGGSVYGARRASALLQFLPITVPYEDVDGYGLRPIIDSLSILLTVTETGGNPDLVQSFDVYEVEGELHRDSVYRANFPVEDYRGEKLFEFSHRGGKGEVEARLFPTARGKEYLERIVNSDWDVYTTDSLFREEFNGLYVVPSEGSPRDGAVIRADLSGSGMRLHVRNHDTLDQNAIYDTIVTYFSFRDTDAVDQMTGQVTEWDNVSVGMAEWDYSGSVLGELEARTNGFTDTLATSEPLETVYVQGMGGVGTYLRFTDSFVATVSALGDGDRDVLINQAMMRIWLEDDGVDVLDSSVERLGSYVDYRFLNPIPDYRYAVESQYQGGLPYGGYLNRSRGYYELDITTYVQRLAAGKMPRAVYLGPEAFDVFCYENSELSGDDITIRVTYTTIER